MDELKNLEACKKEKDVKICTRMLAVRMVRICGLRQNKVAVLLNMTDKTVSKWVKRFDNGYGLSPKRPRIHHVKKAKKSNIVQWQYRLKEHISRLKKKKFIVFLQD